MRFMSENSQKREWRFYLDDMIGFCEKIMLFTHGINQAQLLADAMRFDATVRNIELIGEAATHIPEHIRASSPTIHWRMVIATRNQLIHGYLGIDNDTLWSIVETDIPALHIGLQALRATLPT
jgi:uncharacterized protein with HEPN domain